MKNNTAFIAVLSGAVAILSGVVIVESCSLWSPLPIGTRSEERVTRPPPQAPIPEKLKVPLAPEAVVRQRYVPEEPVILPPPQAMTPEELKAPLTPEMIARQHQVPKNPPAGFSVLPGINSALC